MLPLEFEIAVDRLETLSLDFAPRYPLNHLFVEQTREHLRTCIEHLQLRSHIVLLKPPDGKQASKTVTQPILFHLFIPVNPLTSFEVNE